MTMDPRDKKFDPNSDSDLEQELEKLRSAWPELEAAEPPRLVDQAIMNMARRELPPQGSGRRPLRWLSAFATAAVVVLALTIVIQQDEQALAPVLEEQDGFRLDALKKQEAKRDESSVVDPGPGRDQEARQAKNQELAEELPVMSASSPEPQAADDSSAAVAPQAAAPAARKTAAAEKSITNISTEPEQAGKKAAFEAAANIPESAGEFSDAAEDIPDPAQWVERLLLLHQSQLYEKLEAELAAFREAYPDYPLPTELRN